MAKHPLLPKEYTDSATQSAIFYALNSYKITERPDVVNPQLKWNLHKAWQDAKELLARSKWQFRGDSENIHAGYELSANSEKEMHNINIIMAGIVACQIIEPEYGLTFSSIEHKKGGEITLVISSPMANILKGMFPGVRFLGYNNGKMRGTFFHVLQNMHKFLGRLLKSDKKYL